MSIKFKDIEYAYHHVNAGQSIDDQAYLNIATGEVHLHSEFGDNFENLPDDVAGQKYIVLPDKHDLNLGQALVFEFIKKYIPDEEEQFSRIFRRRNAFVKFNNFLEKNGLLAKWYAFESQAEEKALRAWCAAKGIDLTD